MLPRLTSSQSEGSEKASKLKICPVGKTALKTPRRDSSLVQDLLFLIAAVPPQETNLPKRNLAADTDAVPCHAAPQNEDHSLKFTDAGLQSLFIA